jgi:polysaccharide deacetylase family protein (PEP-CTERM system associated)
MTTPSQKEHVFSVDVEDWYQGIELPMSEWDRYEPRVETSMGRLLDLLVKHNVKCTCFILGRLAEEHPALVKKIHEEGHEIATHGYSHEKIYNLEPAQFKEQLKRSLGTLEDITGESVIGHRASYFSITKESLWALDILSEEGILYDSSIHPVINYRYGIADADRFSSILETRQGNKMLEIPVSTYAFWKVNIPVGGGAYLRIYPYFFLKSCLASLEKKNENISIYMHPWELDPDQPKIKLPWRVSLTHYFNLRSTEAKLDRLLSDFIFKPYKEIYRTVLAGIAK